MLRTLPKIIKQCTSFRYLSSKTNIAVDTSGFLPVYKFPYIRAMSLVNRLKMYQTYLTGVSVPGSCVMYALGLIDSGGITFISVLGVSGCITLYTMGFWTQKFIGFVYYNPENDLAKISYVDFYGKRQNVEVDVNDIVPLSDLAKTPLDGLYLTFRRYSTNDTLRISHKYGMVLDKENFNKVFK